MISRHIEEVFAIFRLGGLKAYKGDTQLVIARLDTYPEDGDDVIVYLSNGKKITITDLEFADIKDNTVTLGDYHFTVED